MGCDIHAYVEEVWEYNERDSKAYKSASHIASFHHMNRYYGLFACMAGVRNYWDLYPVVAPRGLPNDPGISYRVRKESNFRVNDERNNAGCDDYVSRADAERWTESGWSKWYDDRQDEVTHPDWHTYSWLTTDEFAKAIEQFEALLNNEHEEDNIPGGITQAPADYRGCLALMREIDKQENSTARLVFWFDN